MKKAERAKTSEREKERENKKREKMKEREEREAKHDGFLKQAENQSAVSFLSSSRKTFTELERKCSQACRKIHLFNEFDLFFVHFIFRNLRYIKRYQSFNYLFDH